MRVVSNKWLLVGVALAGITGCNQQPPDVRPVINVTAPTVGDANQGAKLYDQLCVQCHITELGDNRKGPHLLGIYGAQAALLSDYNYSEVLSQSGWVWDSQTLHPYIHDAQQALPGNRMHADSVPDADERDDIIAYLATLQTPAQSNNLQE